MRDELQIGFEKARPERDQRVIVDRPYVRTARWTWVHLVRDRDERQRSFRCGLRGLRSGLPEALRQALSLRKLLHRVLQMVSRRASKSSGNVIAVHCCIMCIYICATTAVCVCRTMFACMALTTGQGGQSCSWSAAEQGK